MASIRMLYLAVLRDRLGRSHDTIELPPGVTDVGGLLDWMRGREPALAAFEAGDGRGGRVVRVAVNQVFAGPDAAIGDGDEVALVPPVTGG